MSKFFSFNDVDGDEFIVNVDKVEYVRFIIDTDHPAPPPGANNVVISVEKTVLRTIVTDDVYGEIRSAFLSG